MTAFSVTMRYNGHWLIVSGMESRYYSATWDRDEEGGIEEIKSVSLMRGEKSRRLKNIDKLSDDSEFIRKVFDALQEK